MTHRARTETWVLCIVISCAAPLAAAERVEEYAAAVAKTEGLAAWWRFEGDLKDAQGVADGSAVGGEARFAPGPGGGKAVVLDGRRLVTMGAAPKLDLPQATVELWFKPTFTGARYNPCLIAKRAAGDHKQTRFSIHVWGDYSCLAVWNGRSVSRFTPAAGQIERGKWYYLAVTSTAAELRMYLDGVPCVPEKASSTFTFANKHLPLQVASSTPQGQELLDCVLDEVAIYSRVLSGDEIAAHADAMGWKDRREAVARKLADLKAAHEKRSKQRLAELTDEKRLFARGATKTYRGEQLTAISLPVGGIGTGVIQMDGQGRLAVWQIFNNYQYAHVPHSFFAVRVQAGRAKPVVRALQTEAVGPFAPMKELTFQGEYPFGWYAFDDPALPVKLRLEVYSPLVPGLVKPSGMPCAVFRFEAHNTGARAVQVALLASQQNAAGYLGKTPITGRACKDYGQNVTRVVRAKEDPLKHGPRVHMTTKRPKTAAPGYGDMVLMAPLDPAPTATASWQDLAALHADLADDGKLSGPAEAGPSPAGATLDAAMSSAVSLAPGKKAVVVFVLAWHFPGGGHGHGKWGGRGSMYQNWWADAMAVADDIEANGRHHYDLTRLYHDTLYASNLPQWLIDRIANQVAILRSMTCFWTKDGYFGGWEGCCPASGCCHGNCSHVWHYAQAHARLFPEVARRMREQEFRYQEASGSVPHRQPRSHTATDGQCGAVLNSYREHLMSADGGWLKKHWASIRKAMDFTIATWDADGDGVMAGRQWNTLDCAIDGSSSWLGSLYLAALAAAEKMADLQGDRKLAARYRKIRLSGMAGQDETLFNGEYYVQLPGKTRLRDYLTGCHIDQVLGQWWAHQLDLGWLLPRDRVRTALGSLVKYNFRTDFHGVRQVPRKFVADEDAGMQMITWPKGGRPPGGKCMLYGDEVMTGFEYAAAATMVQAGMVAEGFMVTRAIHERYDGRRRTGLTASRTASWGWSGNPFGDDECGKFYARAMSVWSMLLACQGCVYDGPAGLIGFRPVWKPDDHRSMFTAAEGWGLFSQRRDKGKQTDRIELRYGRLGLKTLLFELPEGAKPAKVTAGVGEKKAAAKFTATGRDVRIDLGGVLSLQAGETLRVEISY